MSGSSGAILQLVERFVTVAAGSELRFEMECGQDVRLKVVGGTCECFGAELAPQHEYDLKGPLKLAVYSVDGCEISLKATGPLAVEYVSADAAAGRYLQIFQDILGAPPSSLPAIKVLVLGEGRNSLARAFVNYGIRLSNDDTSGWALPLLVNLDVQNGTVLFPGVVGALPSTPHRPYELSDFRGALLDASGASPLSFFYGHASVKDNFKMYGRLIHALLLACEQRLQKCQEQRPSQRPLMIAVGPGEGVEESVLVELGLRERFTHIVVIGNERLMSALQRRNFPNVHLIKAPKSAGYVPRASACRRQELERQMEGYFYGSHHELTPYSSVVAFADVCIYRVGEEASVAPSSALPLGATRKVDETRFARLQECTSSHLQYAVMAVSSSLDEAGIAEAPVAGYVHVTHVDEARQTLTLLCPCPGELYSKHLLLGSLKWIPSSTS